MYTSFSGGRMANVMGYKTCDINLWEYIYTQQLLYISPCSCFHFTMNDILGILQRTAQCLTAVDKQPMHPLLLSTPLDGMLLYQRVILHKLELEGK